MKGYPADGKALFLLVPYEDLTNQSQIINLQRYTYDDDICDNVMQFRSTESFGFLEEFYGQGSGGEFGDNAVEALKEPDRTASTAEPVGAAETTRGVLFGLQTALGTIGDVYKAICELAVRCVEKCDMPNPTFVLTSHVVWFAHL